MKVSKKIIASALACAVAVGVVGAAGCSSSSSSSDSSEAPSADKVLKVAGSTYSVDTSIDPLDGSWNYCYVCYEGMAETLFRITDDWGAEAWLATNAEAVNEEHTIWSVTLRDDVTYHNGNKMTAESVKACLERAMSESAQAQGILNMTSIEADGQTLTITLDSACYDLQHELCNSVFVIYDVPESGEADDISYTGPFMPGEYEPGVKRTFVANTNYYGGMPKLAEVDFIVYADDSASLMALKNGEVDFLMSVPFNELQSFEEDSAYTVSYADPNSDEYIYFNENHAGVNDTAVKHAIAYCLNREKICEDVFYGYAEPLYTIFNDSLYYGGTDGLDLTVTGYDPEAAKQLLADAGYADTNGDGTLDKDGVELDFTVVAYPDQYILNAADMLTNELAEIGIKLTVNAAYDYPTYEASGDFDILWTYEGFTRSGTPQYFLSNFFSTTGAGNYGGFSSAAVDEACEKLLSTTDEDEVRTLVQQAEQAIADDGHAITWANRAIPFVYSSDVTFTPHAYRYYMIDQTTDIAVG